MTPVYGYPGHVLLALVPLGALPLEPAAFIWGAAGIAFAILGVRALLHAYVPGLPVIHTLTGFTLIASQPAVLALHNGQWGFPLVGLVSLSGLRLRGGHDLRAGVALVAVSIAVMPRWPGEWIHVVSGRLPLRPQATAVPTAFADLFGPAGLALGALLIVALAVAVVAFDPRSDAAIAVALAVSGVVVPYAWSYDQLLLVVSPVITAGLVARRSPPRGVALMCMGSVLLLLVGTLLHTLLGEARQSESYNAVVPALMALLIVAGLWPLRGAGTGSPPPSWYPAPDERN